jgi:hypothetical protein
MTERYDESVADPAEVTQEELAGGRGSQPAAWSQAWSRAWSQTRFRVPLIALMVLGGAGLLLTTQPWESRPQPAAAPSHTEQPIVPYPAPVTGHCFTYTFGEFSKSVEHSDPVPCTDPRHTAYTVAVIQSTTIHLPYDNVDAAAAAAVAACQPPVAHLTGAGRGVQFSAILGSVFEPDHYQLAAGQRWLRCDVVEVTPYHLKPLPANLANLLTSGPDVRDALCVHPTAWVTGRDDDPTIEGWADIADCSDAGTVVAVRAEPAWPPGTRWPGAARARAAAARACVRASQHFVGLALRPAPPSRTSWSPNTFGVADRSAYGRWVADGKRLT